MFEVDVELGQIRTHPIHHRRTVGRPSSRKTTRRCRRSRAPRGLPVGAPPQPRPRSSPARLCLYDEQFRDLKKTWTAARFIERSAEWLALDRQGEAAPGGPAARAALLRADHIIIPDDLFSDERSFSQRLAIEPIKYPDRDIRLHVEEALHPRPRRPSPKRRPEEGTARIRRTRLPLRPPESRDHPNRPANIHDLTRAPGRSRHDLLPDFRARRQGVETGRGHSRVPPSS